MQEVSGSIPLGSTIVPRGGKSASVKREKNFDRMEPSLMWDVNVVRLIER